MRIVHIVLLAILATLTVSLVAGAGHVNTPALSSITRVATAGPVAASSLTAVTRAATAGPINSSPIKGIARTATAGPVNSSPIKGIARTATAGPVGTSSLTAVTRTATAGPVGTDAMTAMTAITRALVAGPIEDLVKAVVNATRGASRAVLEVCPSGCAYSSIQDAIDAASDGDEVLVHPGTYTGSGDDVVFIGNKDLLLHSNSGPESTIIDGEGARRVLTVTGSTNGSYIEGFTITGGANTYSNAPEGGGINVQGSSTISNCVISGNSPGGDYGKGGGICCNGSPTIIGCTISGNSAYEGGGIYVNSSTALITGCIISGNNANYGAGVHAKDYPGANFENCLITNNNAPGTVGGYGGGVYVVDSNPRFTSCTISSNYAGNYNSGGGAYFGTYTYSTLTDCVVCDNFSGAQYSQIQGPWTNNGGNTVSNSCPPTGTCCVSECGISVACWDDTTLGECDDLGGEWTAGAICADINCGPVQWTVEDGGADQWHQVILLDEALCWDEARDVAQQQGGQLVSLETLEELFYVESLIADSGFEYNSGVPIGLYQDCDDESCEPDLNWRWLSGEPLSYDQWAGTLDDAAGCQDQAYLEESGQFDDAYPCEGLCTSSNYASAMVIEWSADCNDDGIVDYGQILSGELLDEDCDGVPDVCQIELLGACCIGGSCTSDLDEAGCTALSGIYFPADYCSDVDCTDIVTVDDDGLADYTTIQAAINGSAASTIMVFPGTYYETITLPAHGITISGASAEGDPSLYVIDGEGQRRGLYGDGCGDNGTVIQGLTFQNGSADNGGGVYLNGCSPTFNNCDFISNHSTTETPDYGGGGLHADNSSPSINGCDFISNTAVGPGGGILARTNSNLSLTNCRLESNLASGGVAVYLNSLSNSTFDACSFIDNSTNIGEGNGGGGAVYTHGSEGTFTNCTFSGNHAGALGGAIITFQKPVSIDSCTFSNNSAGSVGGTFYNNGSTLSISNSTVCGSTPDIVAGGLQDLGGNTFRTNCASIGILTVDDDGADEAYADFSTIEDAIYAASDGDEILVYPATSYRPGNELDLDGKAIWLHGLPGKADVTIIDCEQSHRGIICDSGETPDTIIDGFTIHNGVGTKGGGILIDDASPTIRNCIISSNTASANGGGVALVNGSDPVMEHCTISGNFSTYGGGLFIDDGSEPVLTHCDILNNTSSSDGGGLYAEDSSRPTIEFCLVEGNTSSQQGGGLCIQYSSVATITNTRITGNNCFGSEDGAGIYLSFNARAVMSGTTVCNNDSDQLEIVEDSEYDDLGDNYIGNVCPPLGACCVGDCDATSICYDDLWEFECDALGGTLYEGQTCADADCGAEQWTVEDGGNGNWYRAVELDESESAESMLSAVEASGGHLASIANSGEDEFARDIAEVATQDTALLGGYEESDSVFIWLDGTPWIYENWDEDAEQPDGVDSGEYVAYYDISEFDLWHDVTFTDSTVTHYISEWSADCDGDGMVDIEQIGLGLAADIDCNGIPDECQPSGACCTGDVCIGELDEAGCTALSGLYLASAYCSDVDCSDIVTVDDDGTADFTDIQAAIFYSGKSTILVQPGTYEGDIRLPAGFTLIGLGGASQTIIDGGGSDQCAQLTDCNDAGSEPLTTIRGIRFVNGSAQEGAGLYCDTCDVLVVECEFIDNDASAWGGGIAGKYQADNTVTLSDCIFTGNEADQGGAGWFNNNSGGGVTATDCRFDSNLAFSRGGGLFLDNQLDLAVVESCEFIGNNAGEHGGGLESVSSTTSVTGSKFEQNMAGTSGGAVQHTGIGETTVSDSTFCGNSPDDLVDVTDGGGNVNGSYNCDYWIVDDLFDDDPNADFDTIQAAVDAAADGDEILVMPGTYTENIELDGKSILIRSDAGPDATTINGGSNGSVFRSVNAVNSTIELEGLTIKGGTGSLVVGWLSGGGLCVRGENVIARNCVFRDNSAQYGGGSYVERIGDFGSNSYTDCVFMNNTAGDQGAGLATSSPLTLTDCRFEKNASTQEGGGIHLGGFCIADITGCTISNNQAGPETGGGIYVGDTTNGNAIATITDSIICGNTPDQIEGIGTWTADESNYIAEACPPLGACCVGDCEAISICYDDLYDFECTALGGTMHDGMTCVDVGCGQVQWAWGNNEFGQCDVPADLGMVVKIAGGGAHAVALLPDGTVRCWGNNEFGQCNVPTDLGTIIDVDAGDNHTAALQSDGIVRCWGSNSHGQGDVPSDLAPVIAIGVGDNHTLAVLSDGTVRAWGNNQWGATNVPVDLNNVMSVSGGASFSIALKSDGTITGWGGDESSEITVPVHSDVVEIRVKGYNSMAIDASGNVIAWGRNWFEQADLPADLGPCRTIGLGFQHGMAITIDGSIVCWGGNGNAGDQGQCDFPQINPMASLGVSGLYGMAWIPYTDCNDDGLADFEQIALGELADIDCNGIPDSCLAPVGYGACCTAADTCVDDIYVDDCTGYFYENADCSDTTCPSKVTVDPNAEGDDPANGIFSTIQGAIDASYAGMEINLLAGTYTGDGDSVITLPAHSITIMGIDGAENTIIDGDNQRRCLVNNGCGEDGYLLQGLTFQHGAAANGAGASINNCDVTFIDCDFIDNHAASDAGALQFHTGTLTVIGGSFQANTGNSVTSHGGAVNVTGTTTFTDVEFIGNSLPGEASAGGAIFFNSGFQTFVSCRFEDNSTANQAGAVYSQNGDTNFTDCTFEQNHAGNVAGAFRMDVGTTTLTNCTVQNNTSDGTTGGLQRFGGTLTVCGSTICDNTIPQISGEYENDCDANSIRTYCENAGPWLVVDDDLLDEPLADFTDIQSAVDAASDGDEILVMPGMYDYGQVQVSKSLNIHGLDGERLNTIIDAQVHINSATWPTPAINVRLAHMTIQNGDGGWGGGILSEESHTVVHDCIIQGNTAARGAGIATDASTIDDDTNTRNGSLTVTDCLIQSNTSDTNPWRGSAIYISTPTWVTNCTIRNNACSQGESGGAIELSSDGEGSLTLTDTVLCNNTPLDIAGTYTDGGGNTFPDECPPDAGNGACCVSIYPPCDLYRTCTSNISETDCTDLGGEFFVGDNCNQITCEAVQWRAEDGGNGNWYRYIEPTEGIQWEDSRLAAEQIGGHLVCPNTTDEAEYVNTVILDGNGVPVDQPVNMGLYRPTDAPIGDWQWLDGSGAPTDYTWAGGEPNLSANEWGTVLLKKDGDATRLWCDTPSQDLNFGYVIEWDTDCNGDDIVDYGQILDGTLSDLDCNGIPDVCMPIPGEGACCTGLDACVVTTAEACDGIFLEQQPCSEEICPTSLTVDDDGLDDPDADFNSIQGAIDASYEGMTINVQPGTYTGTGDSVITLPDHGITIVGTGGATIIDGEDTRRGLTGDGCGGTGTLIQGVNFQFCRSPETAYGGGAAYLIGCDCDFIDCVFDSNTAYLRGGAISARNMAISVQGCTFLNNDTYFTNPGGTVGGGGIWTFGLTSLTVTTSSFTSNASPEGYGGGIRIEDTATASVTDCSFTGNTAGLGGGVSPRVVDSFVIDGCTFDSNVATNGGSMWIYGFNAPGTYTVTNCDMNRESTHAIYIADNDQGAGWECRIGSTTFCEISGSPVAGSAVYTDLGGNLFRSNCDYWVVDDLKDDDPDAEFTSIQDAVDAAVEGDEILVMPGTYTSIQDGHVVAMRGKFVTLRSRDGPAVTIIDGENARRGIACYEGETSDTVIEGFTITRGEGVTFDYGAQFGFLHDDGGGMCIHESSPSVVNCVFELGHASGGGGVSCNGGSPTFTDCDFIDNTADFGGGVDCHLNTAALFTRCRFTGNTVTDLGGGVHVLESDPTFDDCDATGNACGNDGGGVYLDESDAQFTNCRVRNNSSINDGAGIACIDSNAQLNACVIELNTIVGDASNAWGGGLYCYYSNPTVTDCTIRNNVSIEYGGGLLTQFSQPTLTNTILCGNSPDQGWDTYWEAPYFTDGGGNVITDGECPPDAGNGACCVSAFPDCDLYRTCYPNLSETECTDQGGEFFLGNACEQISCEAVQWRAEDGGNDHWYRVETTTENITWSDALADSQTANGYLATLTSSEENDWAHELTRNSIPGWIAYGPWIGGFQDLDSSGYFEPDGAWTWVTGEAWGYTAWDTTVPEPNNGYGETEHWLQLTANTYNTTWNDAPNAGGPDAVLSYIIEWSADCNDDDIVDYGQILDGTLTDADCNGIPDECLPVAGSGACCTGVEDSCVVVAEEDCDGVYFEQQPCSDISCSKVIVDSNAEGDGSGIYSTIQAAIADSYEGMTISVMPGTYTGDGDSVITLPAHGITIWGIEGAATTIIDGEGVRRGLTGDGCGGTGTVIEGLTIQNGSSDNGGGVHLNGCNPTFNDCNFSFNAAALSGGGLYCNASNPVLDDCTFLNNSVTVANSEGYGGGIFNTQSSPTLTGCHFEGNYGYGGAAWNQTDSHPSLTNCTFFNNQGPNGGAVSILFGSSSDFTGCDFNMNAAVGEPDGSGGAMYVKQSAPVSLTNCTFTDNSAISNGGALWSVSNSLLIMSNCTFTDNSASNEGGGIYLNGSDATLDGCTLDGNTAWQAGGGMRNNASSPTLTDCIFTNNIASGAGNASGGGIYNDFGSSPTLTNCAFTGNTCANNGGAVRCGGGSESTFTDCTFTQNTAGWHAKSPAFGYGGAYQSNGGTPSFLRCTFTDNQAEWNGGAINLNLGAALTVDDSDFTGNSANDYGGAIYVRSSQSQLTGCQINDNSASSGGGLYIDSSTVTIGDSIICANTPDQILGPYTDNGGNYIADECLPDDGNGACCVNIYPPCDLYRTCIPNLSETECTDQGGEFYLGNACEQISCEAAVQWRAEDGGNGHWFQIVLAGEDIYPTWTDARDFAQYRGGDLVTFETESELDFCRAHLTQPWEGTSLNGAWIGLYQEPGSEEPAGGWYWISGLAASMEWGWAPNEPNNGGAKPESIAFMGVSSNSQWFLFQDYLDTNDFESRNYIIEWSADCNGDGIVDYGQILDGTLTDLDCNGIPDECEGACCTGNDICEITIADDCVDSFYQGQTCADVNCFDKFTVDPNAEGDDPANGIFSTIQGAIDASNDGMTISLMAGTYTGTGDSVITLPAHGITINGASSGGDPSLYVIDGEGVRRGLIGDGCYGNGAVIDGLTFTNCYVTGEFDAEGTGAGMYLYEPCITIRNCDFISNTAQLHGGGIRSVGGTIDLDDSRFIGNQALASVNIGGGGFFSEGTHTLDGCTFESNISDVGAGAGFWGCESAVLTDCSFTGNTGSGAVATILLGNPCTVSLDSCTITDNSNFGIDNNVHEQADLTLTDTVICGNGNEQINGSYTDLGGNTIRTNCDYWVVDDLFDDDPNADFDTIQAAVDVASDGDEILVMPGTYTSTTPQTVVSLYSEQLTIRGTVDENNEPLTIVDGQDARHCLFSHNGSNTGTIIEHIVFTNGTSGHAGGAVQLHYVNSLVFNNCTFSNSHASGTELEGNGGGMYCHEATVSLTDCTFTGNLADNSAGALWIDASDMTLVNTDFIDNVAIRPGGGSDGGGILLSTRAEGTTSTATLTDCLFDGNSSDFGGGIAVDPYAVLDTSLTLDAANCTFRHNTAPQGGGAIRTRNSTAQINDCTFCSNSPDDVNSDGYTGEGNTFADECLPDEGNGACCVAVFPEATCTSDQSAEECDALGGTLSVGVTCESAPCPAVGTCCLGGSSDITFEADCTGQWYEGVDSANCTEGACCLVDGTCIDTIEQECDPATGVFHEGEDCGSFTCPPHAGYGACCVGESCTDHVAAGDCIGDYFEQTLCIDTDCVTGACCLPDGSCVDGVTNSKCAGEFYPKQTCLDVDCTLGACCLPDGSCENTTGQECTGIFYPDQDCSTIDCTLGACCYQDLSCVDTIGEECDGEFTPNLTCADITCLPFPGYGACCLGTGCVDNVLEADCAGDWYEGDLCSDVDCITGACCLDGACTITTEPKCAGTWYEGLTCKDVDCTEGTCCIEGIGSWTTAETCSTNGGDFYAGQTVDCTLGACCYQDLTCVDTIGEECELAGGVFNEGQSCDDEGFKCQPYAGYGACCLGTGCVDNVLEADCAGDWYEGTRCSDVDCITGACCLDDACTITTEPKCAGTWYEGLTCKDVDCTEGTCCIEGIGSWTTAETCSTNGGDFYAGQTVDCTLGACCYQDLTCVDTISEECDGEFTPNLTCADVTCLPFPGYGACCLGTGCVDNVLEADCAGDWYEGTRCSDVDCITGACCLDDACTITTEPKCAGTWYEGLTCKDVDCTEGTCCIEGIGSWTTAETCSTNGGDFYAGQTVDCTLGACCYQDLTCVDTIGEECDGVFTPNQTCADITCLPFPGYGVCCVAAYPETLCFENQTQKECEAADGVWREQDLCGDAICPPSGACCTPLGGCSITFESDCLMPSYWTQGAGCDPNPCIIPDPIGACCLPDGSCVPEQITEGDCYAQDGMQWTEDATCGDVECPQPGACCIDDTTCFDGVQQSDCEGVPFFGQWLGPDSTCANEGAFCSPDPESACCLPSGDCIEVSNTDCTDADGEWHEGVTCEEDPLLCRIEWACCFDDGECEEVTEDVCDLLDGTWYDGKICTDDISCSIPTGACCLDSIYCLEAAEQETCDQFGGDWSKGTACADLDGCNETNIPLGACCIGGNTCYDGIPETSCEAIPGGDWLGEDSTCAVEGAGCVETITGACCLANGNCVDEVTDTSCDIFGGTWNKGLACADIDCLEPGACCRADGSCYETLEATCTSDGNTFWGEGTTCDPNPCPQPTGACCYDDGSCNENMELGECNSGGGDWNEGLTCFEADCPVPTGACCYDDGECDESLLQQTCKTNGGTWNDGLTCIEAACPQPYAACCIDFNCWLQTEADCQLNGGTWYIDSPTCSSNPCTLITVDDDGLDFPGADFATIQEAIDFAIDGWEIVVYPGTYTSTGDYVGNLQSMQLNLHGLPGQAEQTIIDGQDVRRGLRLDDSSPGEVRIAHLTITNGYANSTGGSAMYLIGASPLVESVRVTGNVTTEAGSVFMTAGSEPTFRNCLFEDNEAGGGGAIDARTSSSLPSMPTIESCEFRNNHAVQSGGALSSDAFSSFQISDSIFCGNRCDECEEVEGEPHQHITGNWNDLGGNEFSNFCGEIHVDDGSDWPDPDYTTIQAAVDAAGDGDTIIVHRGIYTTSGSSSTPVVFIGNKSITLLGTDGPAETIIDGDGDHVGISCDGTPSSTRIEGFTISDCKAWSTDSSGGGMRLTGSDVEIADCVITGNVASNLSSQGFGGGVFARDSNAIFQNVQFIGNTAGSAGGGIYVKRESLADINPRLINCLFESNEASTGGAILSFQADLLINHCVIRSNTANTAGAIYIYADEDYPRIRNSVLCGNSLPQLGGHDPQENFNNEISDICTSGACCLDDGTCIDDAAFGAMYDLTCTDLGSTFTAGVTCDDEPCSEPCPADINGDGIVNVSDLLLVIGEWGCSGECPADINDDGTVNVQDLLLVIGEWNCTG